MKLSCLMVTCGFSVEVKVPQDYTKLTQYERMLVRERYIELQKGLCMYCKGPLDEPVSKKLLKRKPLNETVLIREFEKNPVHLQHNHLTNLTEGAVHAYCNAVLWIYHGR